MPSEISSSSAETRRLSKTQNSSVAPPPEQEHLPCPRCDSTNTKFCYYNNYNFSQPRHFCKSCRRYWTHGGTLRDIPVGGGTRKSAKRSRTSASVLGSITASSTTTGSADHNFPLSTTPVLVPLMANHGQFGGGGGGGEIKGNGSISSGNSTVCGSFTSLLNTQAPSFLSVGGFSLGLGSGFEDIGFGLGRAVWPFHGVADNGASIGSGNSGGVGGGAVTGMSTNTWQFETGTENGFVGGGDCFSWPDLAISTPGNGLK